jgi:hypothetical protein
LRKNQIERKVDDLENKLIVKKEPTWKKRSQEIIEILGRLERSEKEESSSIEQIVAELELIEKKRT